MVSLPVLFVAFIDFFSVGFSIFLRRQTIEFSCSFWILFSPFSIYFIAAFFAFFGITFGEITEWEFSMAGRTFEEFFHHLSLTIMFASEKSFILRSMSVFQRS